MVSLDDTITRLTIVILLVYIGYATPIIKKPPLGGFFVMNIFKDYLLPTNNYQTILYIIETIEIPINQKPSITFLLCPS